METDLYLKLISLLKDFDNPVALNAAGIILIFYEKYEDAYILFMYNANINKDERAKEYLDEFVKIKKYIDDFNLALYFAKRKQYKTGRFILEIYFNQGIITINGIKLLMICILKNGSKKEFIKLNEKIKTLELNLNFEKYLEFQKYKKINRLYISLTVPIIATFYFVGQAYRNNETENKASFHQRDIVYKYVEDTSTKELKEVLKDDLEKIFYKKGLSFYKNKDYVNAYKSFKLSYIYTNDSYLKQHNLFLLAKSANYLKQDDAVYFYKEYINEFKKGCYIYEALYDLSLILHGKGDKKAKLFAERIPKESIYFNSKVKKILLGGQ